jgi:hypothetical protein
MTSVIELLRWQNSGRVLEETSMNLQALQQSVDQNDADAVELVRLTSNLVLDKREFEERVQALCIKYKIGAEAVA